MNVKVLFFGATADSTGEREISFVIRDDSQARQILLSIVEKYPKLSSHNLLFSINQEYSYGDEILSDGDELAIFTAVSGG